MTQPGQLLAAEEPRTHRELAAIARGAAIALLGSLVGGGFGFLFTVLMARLASQADFGLIVLATTLLGGASALAIGGADYAAIRFVAAADTPGRKRGAMLTPVALALTTNAAVAIAAAVFARPISVHLLGEPRFTNVLRALALVLPLTVAAHMFSACQSGLERTQGELVRKVVEQGGRIVLAPLGLAAVGVAGAVLGMAGAAAVAAAAVGWLLLRSLPRGGETERVPLRSVVGFSWPQTVANASLQVWAVANMALLARAGGARDVALFGAALALARLPTLIYNALSFRFSPTIARLWERGERDELHDLLQGVTRWVAVVAVPLYAVPIVLAGPLLHLYGAAYAAAATALVLTAIANLYNSLTGPVEWALIMTGRVREEMTANLAATALSLAAAVVVVPRYGVVGAAACMLGYGLVMNTAKAVLVRRSLGMHTYSRGLLGPLAAGAAASAAVWALERAAGLGGTLAGTAALGVLLLALYAVILVRGIGLPAADRRALAGVFRRTGPAPRP